MVKGEGYPIETIELCVAPAVKPPKNHDIQPHSQYELPQLDVYRQSPMRFNPRFTFDRFVVGDCNEYAFSAARAMTREMEINTNALLILSDHGLGKSHLSQALGQTVLSENKRKKVYYLTAEDFTNEMVYSLKNRCIEDFKRKYRQACDLLVLEEVHFLSGKDKVQTELSYTLDSLYESNKKVVFTSSRLPRDIPKLGRQLSSRLSNSLISSITPSRLPDPVTDHRKKGPGSSAENAGQRDGIHGPTFEKRYQADGECAQQCWCQKPAYEARPESGAGERNPGRFDRVPLRRRQPSSHSGHHMPPLPGIGGGTLFKIPPEKCGSAP